MLRVVSDTAVTVYGQIEFSLSIEYSADYADYPCSIVCVQMLGKDYQSDFQN